MGPSHRVDLSISSLGGCGSAVAGLSSHTADPAVARTLKGLRLRSVRNLVDEGRPVHRQTHALDLVQLMQMTANLDLDTTKGLRDRALLLIGFAGFTRRSELVALNVADVETRDHQKLIVKFARSKTDQAGEGRFVGIEAGDNLKRIP